jgi:hypothetical protein
MRAVVRGLVLPRVWVKQYELGVKINGRWKSLCQIEATNHTTAFRKAMLCLKPEHYDKPIRLEQVDDQRQVRRGKS